MQVLSTATPSRRYDLSAPCNTFCAHWLGIGVYHSGILIQVMMASDCLLMASDCLLMTSDDESSCALNSTRDDL